MRKIAVIVCLGVVIILLGFALLLMRPFGHPPSRMDDYIIENGQMETGANNVVAAVVFDYRGFDTLGEATILFISVTAVVVLFRKKRRGLREKEKT